jgi:hypothetical protein
VRRIITLAMSLGLLLSMALPVSAAVESGPKCADIDNLLGNYDGTDGGTNADMPDEFGIILKAPSCERFSYTIYVFDEATSSTPFFTDTWVGDGTTTTLGTTYQVTSADDPDGDIYIYAESWRLNGAGNKLVADRAPDSGFALATLDGVTPGSGVKAG